MKRLIVFSGAGMSAESGLKTFRDSDGLWENYRIEDVATPEAWQKNKALVLEFYNQRRKQLFEAQPNMAHELIARLEEYYDVQIITQNVDNLHERAGSKKVLHLHGELMKARSTADASLIYSLDKPTLNPGDLCEKGSQLRPHIVWFGEMVPMYEPALELTTTADVFLVIGSSLQVYPAAGLVNYCPKNAQRFLIDPNADSLSVPKGFQVISKTATEGMKELFEQLVSQSQ
jgi:NAD-dependent deacetylase